MYSIFDTKAEHFNVPFFMPNQAMAQRAFNDLAVDPKTLVGKHPEDYMLYEVGEFDDITGECKEQKAVCLGHAPQSNIKIKFAKEELEKEEEQLELTN